MTAVVGELPQHLQEHPVQRARAATMAGDHSIQRQIGDGCTSRGTRLPVGGRHTGHAVVVSEPEGLLWALDESDLGTAPPADALLEPDRCIQVTCLTRPSSVVADGTSRLRASSSVMPSSVRSRALR